MNTLRLAVLRPAFVSESARRRLTSTLDTPQASQLRTHGVAMTFVALPPTASAPVADAPGGVPTIQH